MKRTLLVALTICLLAGNIFTAKAGTGDPGCNTGMVVENEQTVGIPDVVILIIGLAAVSIKLFIKRVMVSSEAKGPDDTRSRRLF